MLRPLTLHRCLFAAALAAAAGPALAQQTTAAAWYFSRVTPGEPVAASAAFSGSGVTLYAASNTSLYGTHLDTAHPYSMDFPGWQDTAANGTVDRFASMLSSDPAFETAVRGGQEAADDVRLDPELADFSISAWIQPRAASEYPLGTRQPSEISPNIVQKGRSDELGGFWKVSLGLNRSSTGSLRWFPFCTFRGANGEMAEAGLSNRPAENKLRYYLAEGQIVKFECIKRGATATLNIYVPGSSRPVFTTSGSAANVSNFPISNDAALSVGHKPRTTDPADVYAGVLDNLVIRKD